MRAQHDHSPRRSLLADLQRACVSIPDIDAEGMIHDRNKRDNDDPRKLRHRRSLRSTPQSASVKCFRYAKIA
jgi:hypothetical protein